MKLGIVLLMILLAVDCHADYTKFFERCAKEKNTFDCLKRRALDVLDRAIEDKTVYVINDYVSIAKDPIADREQKSAWDNNNNTALSLDDQLDRKFHEFFSSRSIKLTIPGDVIEGRIKIMC